MSWMDSWSRPGKHAAVPPPLYLTQGDDVPYCRTCGRVISTRKQQQKSATIIKYCSDRCRNRKPGAVDKKIEKAIAALLNDEADSGIEKTAAKTKLTKGDRRITITCDEIEEVVFGNRHDPSKVFGRKKNRASRAIGDDDSEWKSVDMQDEPTTSSDQDEHDEKSNHQPGRPLVRPSQLESDVNGSVGGEKGWAERESETPEELEKRLDGQRRAEEREMVRRAARRAVVFGFVVEGDPHGQDHRKTPGTKAPAGRRDKEEKSSEAEARRKCEAVMNGAVVEPSFAKGNWSIRWRE